ncbi:ABC transporter permease [Cutibacterium equinum]|uniref:ABC transporter permease n=1 Tax=Cutibacterium equinum TaxID=3016342 RepID=A0ABY7R061_9ACTN|nr:ABC transporter permease [Cutibacterium equinum]WCC80683.1 ABC transporter permease [Cutibacterium equinum]
MTSTSSTWRLVASREIGVKLRDKGFIISMIITVVLILAIPVVSSIISSHHDHDGVVVTDDKAAAVVKVAQQDLAARGSGDKIEVVRAADEAEAHRKLHDDDDMVYLHQKDGQWHLDGYDKTPSADGSSTRVMEAAVARAAVADNAEAAGADATAMTRGMSLQTGQVKASEGTSEAVGYMLAVVFSILFMMSAISYGMMIANSVVEEKQSRIVEILLTGVPARQLLIGKIVGNTVLAVGQLVIICGLGMLAVSFSSWSDVITVAMSWSVLWFVLFFLIGFVALASLYAAAGSMASRTEDLQSTAMPLMYLVMIIYFWVVMSMSNLDGLSARIGSYVPIASVVFMPLRMLGHRATWWEPIISIIITLGFTAFAVLVGERIYRRSILQTNGRVSFKNAWRHNESVA